MTRTPTSSATLELVDGLASRGFTAVSAFQFERWQGQGLVARHLRQFEGRGRGSRSRPHPDAPAQAEAAARHTTRGRPAGAIALRMLSDDTLTMSGHGVPDDGVHLAFDWALRRLAQSQTQRRTGARAEGRGAATAKSAARSALAFLDVMAGPGAGAGLGLDYARAADGISQMTAALAYPEELSLTDLVEPAGRLGMLDAGAEEAVHRYVVREELAGRVPFGTSSPDAWSTMRRNARNLPADLLRRAHCLGRILPGLPMMVALDPDHRCGPDLLAVLAEPMIRTLVLMGLCPPAAPQSVIPAIVLASTPGLVDQTFTTLVPVLQGQVEWANEVSQHGMTGIDGISRDIDAALRRQRQSLRRRPA